MKILGLGSNNSNEPNPEDDEAHLQAEELECACRAAEVADAVESPTQ